jgi:hypothetical protein
MDFDLAIYIKAAVSGVPLLFVVIGLVWLWGEMGLKGNAQFISSMLTGFALGLPYMITQTRPPVGDWWLSFGYWFAAVVYGLGLGVLASVLYNINKDLIKKLIEKYTTVRYYEEPVE